MIGVCGTCGQPAEGTESNEGYSDCCNDRIDFDRAISAEDMRAVSEIAARLGFSIKVPEKTLCTVHEAGACFEGCPDAYAMEEA